MRFGVRDDRFDLFYLKRWWLYSKERILIFEQGSRCGLLASRLAQGAEVNVSVSSSSMRGHCGSLSLYWAENSA
jgi:hypothetical protein